MICFWKMATKPIIGSRIIHPIALVKSQGTLYALFLGIVVIATLRTSILDAKKSGVKRSLRHEMKLMMLIVARPGLRTGKII